MRLGWPGLVPGPTMGPQIIGQPGPVGWAPQLESTSPIQPSTPILLLLIFQHASKDTQHQRGKERGQESPYNHPLWVPTPGTPTAGYPGGSPGRQIPAGGECGHATGRGVCHQ